MKNLLIFIKNLKKQTIFALLFGFLVGLPIDGAYLERRFALLINHSSRLTEVEFNDQYKIQDIEAYLDSISPAFISDVRNMAPKYGITPIACGPSSFAIAKIINNKFFGGSLLIGSSYDSNPYEIVERFGLAQNDGLNHKKILGDHAWLELFIHDKVLFIDPTLAQFGKFDHIVYQVFDVGDPNYKTVLKDRYGIIDDRISKLIEKTNQHIPVNEAPYPGLAIEPQALPYFQEIAKVRDIVNIGHTPQPWEKWINFLVKKYI